MYWFVAVMLRWYFSSCQMWPAPIWLPAGVSLFAALLVGPWVAPGIFLGSWLTNAISFSQPLLWAAVIAGGNTIAPAVTAVLMRERVRSDTVTARPADVLFLGVAALLNGAIAAAIGVSAGRWRLMEPVSALISRWFQWTLSYTGAALLLVPLALMLWHKRVSLRPLRGRMREFLIISVILSAMVLFLLKGNSGLPFLVLVPLLWVAVRFSATVAYPMFVAAMTAVIVTTISGNGAYAGAEKTQTFFIFAEMVIGFGTAILLLSAASEQQRTTETALRQLNQELESRVEERTSELRKSKEQMEKAAFHDPLTGLPNRRLLAQRYNACRSAAARKQSGLAVLLVDLDHFKEINDNIGHDAGDVILVETGRRLSAAVREYDVVARMGGDEFAVLLPEVRDHASVDSVCRRIVQALGDRILFNGRHIVIGASIGVALYPEHGDFWQDMYKAADTALYGAKRAGRCRWEWHQDEEAAAMAAK
jgi:diguanylate cyclase (GGDEF)-like protein